MSNEAQPLTEMKIDPARAKSLVSAFKSVQQSVEKKAAGRQVRIVAVSKLKPASDILALHKETGHLHYGENYAQELMEKAKLLPQELRWHFIGGLQSNKCRPLSSSVPNLYLVSSIDSIKKATALNNGRGDLGPPVSEKLNIHIQLNTSGESSKSGLSPGKEVTALAEHVLSNCPHLNLLGLMTIGSFEESTKEGEENSDFKILREERDRLEKELGDSLEGRKLELSMGMSADFENAIESGSGEVRVGSTIFGTRPPRDQFQVQP